MTWFALLLGCVELPPPDRDEREGSDHSDAGPIAADTGEPPPVFAVKVTVDWGTACALDTEGDVHCWGSDEEGRASPPPGPFVDVSVGRQFACGLRPTGGVECWGDTSTLDAASMGPALAMDVGYSELCVVDEAGSLACSGESFTGATPPAGSFVGLSVNGALDCAWDAAGWTTCWGQIDEFFGGVTPPSVELDSVSAGGAHACALRRADGMPVCWGQEQDTEGGPYVRISAGSTTNCAIGAEGGLRCWGWGYVPTGDGRGYSDVSIDDTAYSDVSIDFDFACAVTTAAKVECWGSNEFGQAEPPSQLR